MAQPVFRNPDKFQILPFREWLRKNMPSGTDGFVVEDLDLVIRVYGPNFESDAEGKFILVELKYGMAWIGRAKKMTFGLIHRLLRETDSHRQRYLGFYVLNYDDEDWDKANFKVNGLILSKEELLDFFSLRAFMLDKINAHRTIFNEV